MMGGHNGCGVGHPLAAKGSHITAHLVHEMQWRGVKRSVGLACIRGDKELLCYWRNAKLNLYWFIYMTINIVFLCIRNLTTELV